MQELKHFFSAKDLFAKHVGIELIAVEPGYAKAKMEIGPQHFNVFTTVHGGAIFSLADFTFGVAANSRVNMAIGINTSVSFVKAATSGYLYAEAREQSLNYKLAAYTVHITDDENELVAIFQGTAYHKKQPTIKRDIMEDTKASLHHRKAREQL